MYPPLSTRRRILLALLILGGKSSYSVVKTFLPPGYSGPKFYAMLKRLQTERLIRRSTTINNQQLTINNRRSLRLLPAGLELLERRYGPRIRRLADSRVSVILRPRRGGDEGSHRGSSDSGILRSAQNDTTLNPQDGWSLIILNFPTSQAYSRSRLAGRLTELGCGWLRDGVYVSPYPILDSVAEWSEENRCLDRIFSLSFSLQPSAFSLYTSAWNLPTLSRRYLSLLDRLTIAKGISLPQKRSRAITRIKADFLDLLIADPLLPKPLLPADYPLARVIKVIARPPLFAKGGVLQ